MWLRKDQSDQIDPADPTDHRKPYSRWLDSRDSAVVANTIIWLIHQTNYLLDQQIAALERNFVQSGGYSEQLAAARRAARAQQDPSDRSDPTDPSDQTPNCPACGKAMVLRTARQGKATGSKFWGCSAFPNCKGTKPLSARPGF